MINVNGVNYYRENEIEERVVEKIIDKLVEKNHSDGYIWTNDEESDMIWLLQIVYRDDKHMVSEIENIYRDKLVDKIKRRP